MLVAFPLNAANVLFRRRNALEMLQILAEERVVTVSSLARKTSSSVKVAWSLLKDLEMTEHIERKGRRFAVTDMIQSDYILINIRDRICSRLFKCWAIPSLLYLLRTRGEMTLQEIAQQMQVSYKTAKRALSQLRKAGIVSGREIKGELLKSTERPVELMPRKIHRQAVAYFLQVLQEELPDFTEPVIVFGDASRGAATTSIDILTMTQIASPLERHALFLKRSILAASYTTYHYGSAVNLIYTTEDTWLTQKLDLVANPHPIISLAFDGICVHGTPPQEDKYFELMAKALHFDEQRIHELLEKGYVKRSGEKYMCSKKGLEALRRNKSLLFSEEKIIDGKRVFFIGIEPHSGSSTLFSCFPQ